MYEPFRTNYRAPQTVSPALPVATLIAQPGNNAKPGTLPVAGGLKHISLERNGFKVDCYYADNGKLVKKLECHEGREDEFCYQFDKAGHLLSATKNGKLAERYQYNQAGQRIHAHAISGAMHYDSQGRLSRAGDISFAYNQHGALKQRHSQWGTTQYVYGEDTLLNSATLPSGQKIVYEYDKANPLAPVRKYKNQVLVAELQWHNPLCLKKYRNYEDQLDYTFISNKAGYLDKIRISPIFDEGVCLGLSASDWAENMALDEKRKRLHAFLNHQTMEFKCGSDQVGTVKALFSPAGRVVKYIGYDSFGNVFYDSMPDLFIPIAFAGGLLDRDTGLIHFGFRDYDPTVGRFTAPDPLGDTGGDHDPYDYCVDDPVTMNDPTGLNPALLIIAAIMGVKALGLGFGMGGSSISAGVADAVGGTLQDYSMSDMVASPYYYGQAQEQIERGERANPSRIRPSARDGVLSVAPQAAIMSGASALGGTAATGAGVGLVQGAAALPAVTASLSPAGKRIIAAMDKMHYSRPIQIGVDGLNGVFNPMYSGNNSVVNQTVALAKLIYDNAQHK